MHQSSRFWGRTVDELITTILLSTILQFEIDGFVFEFYAVELAGILYQGR
jgi:hypothetical protein